MSTLYTDIIRANNASAITVPAGQQLHVPGHIIQVATYTTNASLSGTIAGKAGDLAATDGTTWHTVSFAPKTSSSKLLFQTSNISMHETANVGDGFWGLITDGTTLYAATSGTIDYVSWNNAYNGAVISFNHVFNSWGTSTKNLDIRFGYQKSGTGGTRGFITQNQSGGTKLNNIEAG